MSERIEKAACKVDDQGFPIELYRQPMYWSPDYLGPSAWIEHVPFAFWLVDALRPQTLVELGTHYGQSYFGFCQAVATLDIACQCSAVDTWKGDKHAGFYGEDVFRIVSNHNRAYDRFSSLIRSTFDEAREQFDAGSIDLLHIDGLHTYEAVRHDFESWLPRMTSRGVIILHDTNVHLSDFGVYRLMAELHERHPCFEFLHGYGLGVVAVGDHAPTPVMDLIAAGQDPARRDAIRAVFFAQGRACRDRQQEHLKRQPVQ